MERKYYKNIKPKAKEPGKFPKIKKEITWMDANTIKVRNPYRPPVPKKALKSVSKKDREAIS